MQINKDFTDHGNVLQIVKEAQDSEKDQRDAVREAKLFISKRDGQWDPYAWEKMDGRFRGTFDMCSPIIDQIAGEIDQSDFTLKVSPSGGQSTKDTAKILDGLVRNIRNISNAEIVFSQAGRSNVVGGFDAWEVAQDWIDGDSFDQDLFIRRIPNAVDSVWFDPGSVMQDRSDAMWATKLVNMPSVDYHDRWPDGGGMSVGDDRRSNAYWDRKDSITVGQFLYRKPVNIDIVRMNNGAVYKDDENFEKVRDELSQQGITIEIGEDGEEKRRTRKSWRVWSRMYDGDDWLQGAEETVFDFIPIIPVYGNFDNIENKSIYYGKIENLYDSQRSLNYAMSRDIEDGALSPSPTTWMTEEQAAGRDYSQMNTDRAPVRLYNSDPLAPPPMQTGGPVQSSGLQTTVANMQQMIASSSNTFAAGQGNALAAQSGIAGGQQIEQGNIGSIKWFKALEIAICHTGKILINAIPRVYDSTRQARILEEDGTSSIVTLNTVIFDAQTQTNVPLNDLTVGDYDVVCDVGPAFNSQQKETAQAFLDMAAIDPSIAQKGMDVWLRNLNVPGMDIMSERARNELLPTGIIPRSQFTDEEEQQAQAEEQAAAQRPPQEDPNLLIAQAEMLKGQAEQQNAVNKQSEIQGNQQLKAQELQLRESEIQLDIAKFQREKDDKFNVDAANIQQGQQKLDLDQQKIAIAAQQNQDKIDLQTQDQRFDQFMKSQEMVVNILNKQAQTLETLRSAMGVDTIVGPGNTQAYAQQARAVTSAQEGLQEESPESIEIQTLGDNDDITT